MRTFTCRAIVQIIPLLNKVEEDRTGDQNMTNQNRVLDDLSRLATGALGALQGARGEVDGVLRNRLEGILATMNLVTWEEFEAVKTMAIETQAENTLLRDRLDKLEEQLSAIEQPAPVSQDGSEEKTNAPSEDDPAKEKE